MCGICGALQHSSREPVDSQSLAAMQARLGHRGPDDEGWFREGNVGLAMRRLSIIDIAGGQQPKTNEDGSIVVVFNGEIYNYRQLADRLRTRGHVLTTDSDTEVLPHLYEDYGDDCVQHLRGMFAFSLWDRREGKLLLARDRLGIKPLYFTQARTGLLFASEIKALLAHPDVKARVDLDALDAYLSLKYVPAPRTLFAGIQALPPGHTLVAKGGSVQVSRYWDIPYGISAESGRSASSWAEEVEEVLRESVRLRLRSDVPFGAFLSGGVDSSLVVALMTEMLDEPVKTFSVGFDREGTSGDELPYARQVASRFGTDHHEIRITPQDLIDLAETVTWHLDQPIADQATAATLMLSRFASRHVKMVLTGEGGDELFAGYARYQGERLAPLVSALPSGARSVLQTMVDRTSGRRRLKIALNALGQPDEVRRLTNWFPLFSSDAKSRLLGPGSSLGAGQTAERAFEQLLSRCRSRVPLERMLYVDSKLWLPDYLLLRGDKLTMAASLEARVPLLDHRLVELAAAVPAGLKLHGLTRKYILKRLASKLLPHDIIARKKSGFPIPIAAWFRGPAREFIHDHLSPDTLSRRGLFDAAYVARLLEEHDQGRADHSVLLWGLVSVELWQRTFLDRPADLQAVAARGQGGDRRAR